MSITWGGGTVDGQTTRFEGAGSGSLEGYLFARWHYLTGAGTTTWTPPEWVGVSDGDLEYFDVSTKTYRKLKEITRIAPDGNEYECIFNPPEDMGDDYN